jgi:hypothetical protein
MWISLWGDVVLLLAQITISAHIGSIITKAGKHSGDFSRSNHINLCGIMLCDAIVDVAR